MAETIQPKIVKDLLGDIVPTDYFAATDKLKLFQNDFTPDNDTVVGDLTEADFTGYSAATIAVTWIDGQVADFREQVLYPALPAFTQTATTVSNTVYGWYVTDTGGTALKLVKRLDTPVLFDAVGTKLLLKIMMLLEMSAADHAEVTT